MSLALAGHFNLELYTINIASFTNGDPQLAATFDRLPPDCLVLLEDIDSAGIQRENIADDQELVKNPQKKKKSNQKVTLSGLLNAIDGVTSQEGRILIMTSNDPDALDAALIRPGRVDRKVFFGPVSRAVVEQIFIRMYSKDPEEHEDLEAENPVEVKVQHFKLLYNLTGSLLMAGLFHAFRLSRQQFQPLYFRGSLPRPFQRAVLSYLQSFLYLDLTVALSWLISTGKAATVLFLLALFLDAIDFIIASNSSAPTKNTKMKSPLSNASKPKEALALDDQDAQELCHMASTFSSRVPEDKFTPAEIQNFLLMNMMEPEAALAGIGAWVAEMLRAKERTGDGVNRKVAKDQGEPRIEAPPQLNQVQAIDPLKPEAMFLVGSPESADFPLRTHENKKLSTFHSYIPKGDAITAEEKEKQRKIVEYFEHANNNVEPIGHWEQYTSSRYRKTGPSWTLPFPSALPSKAQANRQMDAFFAHGGDKDLVKEAMRLEKPAVHAIQQAENVVSSYHKEEEEEDDEYEREAQIHRYFGSQAPQYLTQDLVRQGKLPLDWNG